jgi:hypothetical protein
MTIQQLYRKADRWIQGDWVTTKRGESLETVNDRGAACFCLDGALHKCYPRARVRRLQKAISTFETGSPAHWRLQGIIAWNDQQGRTIRDVRKVVRLAGV